MKTLALATILAVSLLAAPLAAEAQQEGRVWRIGIPGFYPAAFWRFFPGTIPRGLRELGYVEGKNFVFERRYASPDPGRYPALAAELVAASVDVIVVTGGNPAILAAKSATTTIPIVMMWVIDPVETGIVTSLARPGGNVTGLTWEEGADNPARNFSSSRSWSRQSLVWPWYGTQPSRGLLGTGPRLVLRRTLSAWKFTRVDYSSVEELDRAFATVLKDRPSAIWFVGDRG